MNKTISILFKTTTLCLLVLLNSCKKESDPAPATQDNTPKTNSELLTSGKWLEVDARDPNGSLWGKVAECNKDNLMIFKESGAYEYDAGAKKCDPSEPQIKAGSGVWAFNANETRLKVGNLDYQIQELSDSKMTLLLTGTGFSLEVFYVKR
jgi:hypothetical protein